MGDLFAHPSLLFQEELRVRLLGQEEEIVRRLCEQDRKRLAIRHEFVCVPGESWSEGYQRGYESGGGLG